jgi:transposase
MDEITVVNDEDGWEVVIEWASKFPGRRWAIEGPGNRYAAEFVRQLLSAGESVYPISPSMTAQYRGRRTRGKDDEIDAGSAARVLLANEDLPLYWPMPYEAELKELTRVYHRMRRQLKSLKMSSKAMEFKQAQDAMAGVIKALEVALSDLKRELMASVKRIAPSLLEYRGVGPIVAATLLAEAGRIERFPNQHHFASYCGAAPIRWQSGGSETMRVNPSGNRRLNWAAHIIALCRLGHDQRTKDYRDKKLAEGHTKRQVIRLLKTYICRELYTALKNAQLTAAKQPDAKTNIRRRACGGCGKVA